MVLQFQRASRLWEALIKANLLVEGMGIDPIAFASSTCASPAIRQTARYIVAVDEFFTHLQPGTIANGMYAWLVLCYDDVC